MQGLQGLSASLAAFRAPILAPRAASLGGLQGLARGVARTIPRASQRWQSSSGGGQSLEFRIVASGTMQPGPRPSQPVPTPTGGTALGLHNPPSLSALVVKLKGLTTLRTSPRCQRYNATRTTPLAISPYPNRGTAQGGCTPRPSSLTDTPVFAGLKAPYSFIALTAGPCQPWWHQVPPSCPTLQPSRLKGQPSWLSFLDWQRAMQPGHQSLPQPGAQLIGLHCSGL